MNILGVHFTIPRDMSFNACIRFIQSLPKTNFLEESNLQHFLALERIRMTTDVSLFAVDLTTLEFPIEINCRQSSI